MNKEQEYWKKYNEGFKERVKRNNLLYEKLSVPEKVKYKKKILEECPGNHIERKKYGL